MFVTLVKLSDPLKEEVSIFNFVHFYWNKKICVKFSNSD